MAIEPPFHPSRLTKDPNASAIEPLRRARSLERCQMYWLPSTVPARTAQRQWTLRFLSELLKILIPEGKSTVELFVESDAIYPNYQEVFIQKALDFNPVMGFSRKPNAPLPSIPKSEDADAIRRQEKPFVLEQFFKGVCYWFLRKQTPLQLETFWGCGGMTVLLVKPDGTGEAPVMTVPAGVMKHPAYQAAAKEHDIPGMLQMAGSAQSGFLKKTKQYFGKGWEDRLEYRGLMYVLPKWTSRDFFELPDEDLAHLWEICDLYVAESPTNNGVIIVSAKNLEPFILKIVEDLRMAGVSFY